MSKVSFTAGRIEKASCPADVHQIFIWDDVAKGLGLRVTSNGAKAYIYQGKLHGKTIRITIGNPDTWPIESQWGKDADGKRIEVRRGAREEARRLQGLVDQGIDPRLQMAQQRAATEAAQAEAKRKILTFGDVWPVYIEDRRPGWGKRHYDDHINLAAPGGEKYKRGIGVTQAGPLASLMPVLLSDLDGNRIAKWLEAESAARPTNAAQSYRLLRAFINWSADMPEYCGIIPANAYRARVVKDALPVTQAKDGDCLQREQLKPWFEAVRALSPVTSAYLQGLLLTGARREELAPLRWDDVDFKWRSLTIRDKVEGTRIIPLTPYLSSLLLNLKRINETPPNVRQLRRLKEQEKQWRPSPWVFFSKTSGSGYIKEPRKAHNQALATAGLPHLTVHGLRRSFGTLAEWCEAPVGVVAQIMGHKPSALAEKHYRRRALDLLRMWHEKIEAWMLEQAGIEFSAEQGSNEIKLVKA